MDDAKHSGMLQTTSPSSPSNPVEPDPSAKNQSCLKVISTLEGPQFSETTWGTVRYVAARYGMSYGCDTNSATKLNFHFPLWTHT